MRSFTRTVSALFFVLLLGVAACAPSGRGGDGSAKDTITIENFEFGKNLTVAPGATVTVRNQDKNSDHDVTSNDGTFRTSRLKSGQTGTFKAPMKPGTYPFTCTVHPTMTGALIVAAPTGGSSPS